MVAYEIKHGDFKKTFFSTSPISYKSEHNRIVSFCSTKAPLVATVWAAIFASGRSFNTFSIFRMVVEESF